MSSVLKKGTRFARRYVIEGLIAEGGMASIFRARDEQLQRLVAVKVLYPYYADNHVIRARFAEEGRIQQMLGHPNVVKVYEVLEEPLAIVMEHVDGPTLDEYLAEQGQLDESDILDIAVPVMSALGLAHSRGIIHRDLKPSNILLQPGRGGFDPKVMDFGVAKVKDAKHNLTATGTTVGTLHYMSPEQIVGSKNIDGRADIYSLGVTLYKLVTGEVPFNAPTEFALMMAQVEAPPLPPSKLRPDLAPELEKIILRAMAKKPIDRFQSISELTSAMLTMRRGSETVRDTITTTISQEIIDMAMAADQVAVDRTGEMNLRVVRSSTFAPADNSAEPTAEMEQTRKLVRDKPTEPREDATVELSSSQIIGLSTQDRTAERRFRGHDPSTAPTNVLERKIDKFGRRLDDSAQNVTRLSRSSSKKGTSTQRHSGSVMIRYPTAAMSSGVAPAVWETMSRAKVVSSRSPSAMPAMKSSEVSLMMMTNSLVSGGVMIRKACGSTTEIIVQVGLMPSDFAASTCPFGTAWMPARMVSAM